MTKVVLVCPPVVFGKKEHLGLPPQGILYIATFLKKKGIESRVIDSSVAGYTLVELVKEILKEKPAIVGFSVMTCHIKAVLAITEELKKKAPDLKIVIGGHHVNATKEELLRFTDNVDFLFYGEGEKEFFNLVQALEKNGPLETIRGLIYKKNNKLIIHEPPLLTQNLDDLPFPDLDLLDIRQYDSYYAKSLPLTSLIASRGCPYSCTYCSASLTHGKHFRWRSPGNIVDEMECNYKKYGIRQFLIKDSTFTANKEWVYEICAEIQKRNLRINWSCNTRADLLDEDLLRAMKKSGCYFISFGIESGSPKILDVLKKGITLEKIKKGISLCEKVGIEKTGTFMIGNPEETEKDARETVAFIKELSLDWALIYVTIAYPGTAIYSWAVQNEALRDRLWYMKENKFSFAGGWETNGGLIMPDFPQKKIISIVKKTNRNFYLRPSFILKRLREIRGLSDLTRNFMSMVKLLRKG